MLQRAQDEHSRRSHLRIKSPLGLIVTRLPTRLKPHLGTHGTGSSALISAQVSGTHALNSPAKAALPTCSKKWR